MRFETHAHSMYSNIRLVDCINKPEDLIRKAAELGLAGITLTDHESLSGHVDWLNAEKKLKKDGVIPPDFVCALGNEIYLVDNRKAATKFWHFILIAKNKEGHRALRELSSTAWYNSFRYRGMERVPTTKDELRAIVHKYPNTLIADSACLGSEVAHLTLELIDLEKAKVKDEQIIYNKKLEIVNFCNFCKDLFGDDFHLEVAPSASKDQIKYNKRIKEIARGLNIKLVFGGDSHYLTKKDRLVHKAFLNSKEGEREVDEFYSYAYLMNDEEAFENCAGVFTKEEFDEICHNSIEIMNKIEHYELDHSPIIPETKVKYYAPIKDESLNKYPTLYFLRSEGTDNERYWVNQCLEGLIKINKKNDVIYIKRLEEEADIINTVGNNLGNDLFSYFNTFQSYIDLFWDCGSIVGPGRGSSVCYLSNYLLGITQLDPIEYNLPAFRFLNKERVELPDIDIDLSPSKRPLIFKKIRERVGETNLLQVATFTTVGPRSAVLTACRGYRSNDYPNGIDNDIAQYMASMIPSERGFTWPLKDMVYGNEEKGRKPNKAFIEEVSKYPGLLDIMFGIEGLISTRSQHASGVIIYNKSCCDTGALMRSPGGELTTQYALHQCEQCGDVKFDFLVTEICDKLISTIDLLQKDELLPKDATLRQVYDKYLHPSKLDINDTRIWDALGDGHIIDVFQFSTEVGLQAATSIKPRNPVEMMMANALTRLVGERGQERPIDRYIRLRSNIKYWYDEVHQRGLTEDEIKLIEPYYLPSSGCPMTQEKLMLICIGVANFSLKDAHGARKIVAKKQINKVSGLKQRFIDGCGSEKLANYVWDTCMAPQMSYSFAEPHALAYSYVGIQVLYLATNFPEIYWDCACLISDSGGMEDSLDDNDDANIETEEDETEEAETLKKKTKATNYGKVATAIGKMMAAHINVTAPDINKSEYTFSPDASNNLILHGLSGITRVGKDLIKDIINNRPYNGIDDFINKIRINKPQMINLIKSGAFDSFYKDRFDAMNHYIDLIADKKKRVTLQNMKMLIDFNLIPKEYDLQCKTYNFNKYLKKMKIGNNYGINQIALTFYEKHFDMDLLKLSNSYIFEIKQTDWDKIYKKQMDIIRPFIQRNKEGLLNSINNKLRQDLWDKYCDGNISKWEMDSISCYIHEHELVHLKNSVYGLADFYKLPDEPEVAYRFKSKQTGPLVPLYRIYRIAGTVLDKDKTRKTITLLTKDGVVSVKLFGAAFTHYDRQISQRGADGKKHVIEKSWFTRGNKIIVSGIKQEGMFIGKKYKSNDWHLVELITKIEDNGKIRVKREREAAE